MNEWINKYWKRVKEKQGKSTTTINDRLFYRPNNHAKNQQKLTNKQTKHCSPRAGPRVFCTHREDQKQNKIKIAFLECFHSVRLWEWSLPVMQQYRINVLIVSSNCFLGGRIELCLYYSVRVWGLRLIIAALFFIRRHRDGGSLNELGGVIRC